MIDRAVMRYPTRSQGTGLKSSGARDSQAARGGPEADERSWSTTADVATAGSIGSGATIEREGGTRGGSSDRYTHPGGAADFTGSGTSNDGVDLFGLFTFAIGHTLGCFRSTPLDEVEKRSVVLGRPAPRR